MEYLYKYMMSASTAISQFGVTELQLMILVDTASVIEEGNWVPSTGLIASVPTEEYIYIYV